MGTLDCQRESRAGRSDHRIRHERSRGIDGLDSSAECGETARLHSLRQPDRRHALPKSHEVKWIVKSQHDRSVGIDGLDWLDDSGEKAGVFPATSSLKRKLNGITSE